MKIFVTRQPNNKQGPDVVDPLLISEQAGIARGTREIDYNCSNRSVERGNCVLMPYIPTGSIINVTEHDGSYRGKLLAYSLTIDISEDGRDYSASTSVDIEREMP